MVSKNKNIEGVKEQRKAIHLKKVLQGNETTKTISFKKRFPTLKKKAKELETLCNVSVSMLCFGRDGKLHTFPDDKSALKDLVMGFKRLDENAKKEMNLMGFLEEEARKQKNKKLDEKFLQLYKWLEGLSDADALEFWESKLVGFRERLKLLAWKEQETKKESWGSDFNTYGCGSGLQEDNWICEYNMISEDNPSSSIGLWEKLLLEGGNTNIIL